MPAAGDPSFAVPVLLSFPVGAEAPSELAALRAEVRELKKQLDRQEAILRSAEGVVEFDRELRFVYLNDAAERLLGRSRAQLLGKVLADEFPSTVGSDLERNFHRVIAERQRLCFERVYAPLGFCFAITAHPSLAGGLFAWIRDIAAQKVAEVERERALIAGREVTAELDAIVAHAPIGLGLLDRDLRYLKLNDELAAINGRPAADHLGKTIYEVLPEKLQPPQAMLSQVLDQGLPTAIFELSGLIAAKERCVLSSLYPVRVGSAVVGVAVVALDVTARWRAERGAEILARASGAFMSLEVAEALQAVTETVIPFLADGCGGLTS